MKSPLSISALLSMAFTGMCLLGCAQRESEAVVSTNTGHSEFLAKPSTEIERTELPKFRTLVPDLPPADERHARIETPDARYREETLSIRDYPEMTPALTIEMVMSVVQRPWREKESVMVGNVIDDLLDGEMRAIWDLVYLPALRAKTEERERQGDAAFKQYEAAQAREMGLRLARMYDRNHDGRVTLGELGGLGLEMAPITYRKGKLSYKSIIYKYLVFLRYGDDNKNGRVDSWEDGFMRGVSFDIAKSRGDPDYHIKTFPVSQHASLPSDSLLPAMPQSPPMTDASGDL